MTRLWHGALAVLVLGALLGQTEGVIRTGTGLVDLFSYFTIQSNILVMVTAALIAVRPDRHGRAWGILRLAALVGITVTGVVYAVAIGPYVSLAGAAWWYDKIFHYVVPGMAVLGHVALRPRTGFERRDLVFIAWPIIWLAYTMVRGAQGSPSFAAPQDRLSRYPYDFLDVDVHGAASVAVAAVVVTVLMLAVASVYVRAGRRDRRPVSAGRAAPGPPPVP
ncbi:Pr6Pr family membrane protein [Aeromicrobium sp. CTD01-1L150]|uniref:Pr6Pr family membrane protein n=1 Tax=Aeromicrobium sp. CTD01-1L150 TaxID=3341830 RepID=UPI0035BED467